MFSSGDLQVRSLYSSFYSTSLFRALLLCGFRQCWVFLLPTCLPGYQSPCLLTPETDLLDLAGSFISAQPLNVGPANFEAKHRSFTNLFSHSAKISQTPTMCQAGTVLGAVDTTVDGSDLMELPCSRGRQIMK